MKSIYKHLSHTDKDTIMIELSKNPKIKTIAKLLNIEHSTIYREIKRNKITQVKGFKQLEVYLSSSTHIKYLDCRKSNNNAFKFTEDVAHIIKIILK